MRLAVLGCGTRTSRLLQRVISAPQQTRISRITACLRSDESAAWLRKVSKRDNDFLKVVDEDHRDAIASADVLLLGSNQYPLRKVVREAGMAEVLHKKKIISILSGLSLPHFRNVIPPGGQIDIIHARPGLSMTLICDNPDASAELKEFATWFFEQIGPVALVTETAYEVGAVLTQACGVWTKVAMEGLVNAGLKRGLSRGIATQSAAQSLEGLTELLHGQEDSMSAPGGFERRVMRAAFSESIVQTIETAKRNK